MDRIIKYINIFSSAIFYNTMIESFFIVINNYKYSENNKLVFYVNFITVFISLTLSVISSCLIYYRNNKKIIVQTPVAKKYKSICWLILCLLIIIISLIIISLSVINKTPYYNILLFLTRIIYSSFAYMYGLQLYLTINSYMKYKNNNS